MSNNVQPINSTLSEYEAPISEEYNIVDSSSSAYSNQKTMDHISTQAKENASGDTMSTPSSKDLNPTTYVASGAGKKKYLREFRIKINSKGYKVMDYDEISAIKKVFKKTNSNKDYLINCNNHLYKGCKGKITKLYK
jgi:hypothetical protein